MKLELKQQHYLLILIIALVAAGGGFFVGKASTSTAGAPAPGNFGQFGNNGGQMMGGNNGSGATARTRNGSQMINGEITAVDNDSITIKTSDGSSKIVLLSGSASVVQTSTASKNDLKTGTKVAIFGTANTDGSVTAKSVQINPQTVGFGGPGASGTIAPQQP